MKNIITFIAFITYIVLVFYIDNYLILSSLIALNILLMVLFKINIKKALVNLLHILVFIIFTAIINTLLMNIYEGLLITIRLLIVCNATYIFSKIVTVLELSKIIETLLFPLKIIKINTKDIGIIVCIAITFVYVIIHEIENIKYSINSKGYKLNFKNIILHSNLILNPLFLSLLNKVNEMEYSLKSKAYLE